MSLGPKGTAQAAKAPAKGHAQAKHKDKAAAATKGDQDEAALYKHKVVQLMEMTRRSEEEVCSALNDCDFDVAKACDLLFEEADDRANRNRWQTKEKKKKKAPPPAETPPAAPPAANSAAPDADNDWDETATPAAAAGPHTQQRDSAGAGTAHRGQRGRFQSRPYRGRGGDGSAGEDPDGSGHRGGPGGLRRGGGRGAGRGGARGATRGGRGGSRGARLGGRPPRTMDSWDGETLRTNDRSADAFPSPDDWDNEEWSGSLADTKVFTPSGVNGADGEPVPVAATAVIPEHANSQVAPMSEEERVKRVVAEMTSASPAQAVPLTRDPAIYGYTKSHSADEPPPLSGSLSAAQTQYLTQLTRKSEMNDRSPLNAARAYGSNYGVVYGSSDPTAQRKPLQRARVPPPSKIPSSAVEMPGDQGSSSIEPLDVRFGALDFNSDAGNFLSDSISQSSSVPNDKYDGGLDRLDDDQSNSVSQQSTCPDPLQAAAPSSLSSDISQYSTGASSSGQMLTSEALSSAVSAEQNASSVSSSVNSMHYASTPVAQRAPQPTSAQQVVQLTTVSGLESQLTAAAKAATADMTGHSVYSAYPNQVQYAKPYHPTAQPAYPYSQVNSNTTSLTAASSTTAGNISNSYSQSNSHYQQSQSINTYQNSSVYGNSGLYSTSSIPYGYQTANKIGSKEYDNSVASTNSLSNTPTTQSKVSGSSTASKSIASSATSGVLSSAPVMGQYILGQTFFPGQMTTYSFEDMQILPQRLTHVPGYYDMGYGASTGATGTRDGAIPSFASLGSTDGRFSRTEAPSPSQGGHQGGSQPPTGPPVQQAQQPATLMGTQPYAYFYGQGMMPGSFPPYSTPPMYQLTTGSAASSSYASGKGVGGGAGGYVSGVGSAYGTPQPTNAPQPQYDSTPQPQQTQQHEYKTSGGYSSSQQSSNVKQSGVMNSNSGSTDLSNSMYGGSKSHVSLNKVNSYDKAAYHSATPPPPFGLTGNAAGNAGGYATPQHMTYISHNAIPQPSQQHQPQLQIDGRGTNSHSRRDNGTSSSRSSASSQSKQGSGTKAGYSPPYWNPNSNC